MNTVTKGMTELVGLRCALQDFISDNDYCSYRRREKCVCVCVWGGVSMFNSAHKDAFKWINGL